MVLLTPAYRFSSGPQMCDRVRDSGGSASHYDSKEFAGPEIALQTYARTLTGETQSSKVTPQVQGDRNH